MSPPAITIDTIKKRADFLKAAGSGHKFVVQSFIVQIAYNPHLPEHSARVGYTVTKKMGGAVARNRIKRRLRESVREVLPALAKSQHDYVLIARSKALNCDFQSLISDMRFAFSRIGSKKPANV